MNESILPRKEKLISLMQHVSWTMPVMQTINEWAPRMMGLSLSLSNDKSTWTDGWIDGRHQEIHLPLRPEGFPNQEAERHMRTTLPTNKHWYSVWLHGSTPRTMLQRAKQELHHRATSLQHMKLLFMCQVVLQWELTGWQCTSLF